MSLPHSPTCNTLCGNLKYRSESRNFANSTFCFTTIRCCRRRRFPYYSRLWWYFNLFRLISRLIHPQDLSAYKYIPSESNVQKSLWWSWWWIKTQFCHNQKLIPSVSLITQCSVIYHQMNEAGAKSRETEYQATCCWYLATYAANDKPCMTIKTKNKKRPAAITIFALPITFDFLLFSVSGLSTARSAR